MASAIDFKIKYFDKVSIDELSMSHTSRGWSSLWGDRTRRLIL